MPASVRLAAASAVAASLFVTAPAKAADLYEPPWAHEGGSFYYDHKRSADIYRGDGPRYEDYTPVENFAPSYDPPRYRADYDACVSRHAARDRLRADGWSHFRDIERREHVVLLQARRPSGRLFDLTIDRCSGEVVEARPLHDGRDFAYRTWRY